MLMTPSVRGNGSRTLEKHESSGTAQQYWNPYAAGLGLGLTLLAAFVIVGRGLGASGGFTTVVSIGVSAVAPAHASSNEVYSAHLENESGNPLKDWLVLEILGVFVGGFISGRLARRTRLSTVKGPRISTTGRLLFAFAGGALMGFAAKLARGCTSGQALTGGALMSAGSWIFMIAVFIGAYAFAYFVRRQWT